MSQHAAGRSRRRIGRVFASIRERERSAGRFVVPLSRLNSVRVTAQNIALVVGIFCGPAVCGTVCLRGSNGVRLVAAVSFDAVNYVITFQSSLPCGARDGSDHRHDNIRTLAYCWRSSHKFAKS